MKNARLELKDKDKKYFKFKSNKKLHIEIKDELNSGLKSNIIKGKFKLKNIEKSKLKKRKETKIKNEIKYKLKTKGENEGKKRNDLLNIKTSSLEIEAKLQIEKKNLILQDKLHNEIQTHNNINISSNNKSIIKGNNNIITKKNNIKNQTSLGTSSFSSEKRREEKRRKEKRREEKRREEKKLIIPGEALRIKRVKDKNSFFEDKNKSGKYLGLKEFIINLRNLFRNNNIYLILLIISLIQIVLSNHNIKYIEYKFSNITLKINGVGNKTVFTSYSDFKEEYYPNVIYINGIKQSTITYIYYLNETDNFVKLIWNNSINYCGCMFRECKDITEINLSNFDTSKVMNTGFMFSGCSSLYSIDLSNFDTSEVKFMGAMFQGCSSLSSLNLSNFNTSKVQDMGYMFNACSLLFSLDLFNFDTSKVEVMWYMFQECSSLSSLNISNFDTSKVTKMRYMFNGCSSLSSLDLSNFDTSKVTELNYMFYNCKYLEYINLKNFIENEILSVNDMFKNVPDNVVVCLNKNSTKIKNEIEKKSNYTIDCSNDYKNILISNSIINSNEYESCYNISLNEQLCIKCNKDYYEKENDNYTNINNYIKCYKDPIGYFLDKNESKYKKCFNTCKECEINGDNIAHNCLKCNDNYLYEIKMNNYSNCYIKCNYYHYFNNNNYYCTINSSCPEKYSKLIEDKMECVKNFEIKNIIEDMIEKNETVEKTKEEEIQYYDTILKKIENSFTDENYDTSELDKGKNEIIETEKMTITFTTTQNQKNNLNDNMTSIDLGECEILLRKYYNLTNNETLYMKKLDIKQEGMKISKVEYDVYCKLNGTNLIKLNLSVCQSSKISLIVPIEITDSVDILNTSSEYYNDICYTTT